jgi:hypothetical protein
VSLPQYVSTSMGAALTGRSRKAITKLIGIGVLQSQGKTWQRVSLSSIEQLIGHQIAAEEFLAADRRLDAARATQARANARKRQFYTAEKGN